MSDIHFHVDEFDRVDPYKIDINAMIEMTLVVTKEDIDKCMEDKNPQQEFERRCRFTLDQNQLPYSWLTEYGRSQLIGRREWSVYNDVAVEFPQVTDIQWGDFE